MNGRGNAFGNIGQGGQQGFGSMLQGLMGGMGQGGGMGGMQGMGGIASLLSGLFGDSGSPYGDASDMYKQYMDKAQGALQPYSDAGQAALGPYADMLKNMSDPSGFVNHLMGQYQESPWAKFSQQQGTRAAQNLGSAQGLTGSTPLTQFAQQNAQNISSQDMQNWLGNALGVNTQALGGYGNLAGMGAGAANSMANLYNQGGQNMAGMAYGQGAGQQQDMANIIGGIGSIASMFL